MKAGDLRDVHIEIDLLHMCAPGQRFEVSSFYKDIISVEVASPLLNSLLFLYSSLRCALQKIHSLHLAEQSTRELPTHSQEGDTFEESASGFDTLLTRVRLFFFSSLLFSSL